MTVLCGEILGLWPDRFRLWPERISIVDYTLPIVIVVKVIVMVLLSICGACIVAKRRKKNRNAANTSPVPQGGEGVVYAPMQLHPTSQNIPQPAPHYHAAGSVTHPNNQLDAWNTYAAGNGVPPKEPTPPPMLLCM